MNRIEQMITKINGTIKEKKISKDKLKEMNKSLDMSIEEFCKFQSIKSEAYLNGNLSLNESTTVYSLLGETIDTFNGRTFAEKYVLTKLFEELLSLSIQISKQTV